MPNSKRLFISVLFTAIAAVSVLSDSCRKRGQTEPDEMEMKAGREPEEYSATVIRTILDGDSQQTTVTKEARSGELRRVEWSEGAQNLAVIFRAEQGNAYLLDLDRQLYVESTFNADNQLPGNNSQIQEPRNADPISLTVQAVDRAIDDVPSPDHVETRGLPTSQVDGHNCDVQEQRATFIDGHTEITKTFRAPELGGLILKIESSSDPPSVRVITERKDVNLDVTPATFSVPSNFKRVDKITH
jgi:hypothetical protein